MKLKVGVALTTINIPKNLKNFFEFLQGSSNDVRFEFYVILDQNTNSETKSYCEQFQNQSGTAGIEILDPSQQISIFKDNLSLMVTTIPFSSIQRRNFGVLYALMQDCQVVYLLDDDNFPISNSFVSSAKLIGKENIFEDVQHISGWVNTCDFIDCVNGDRIFHRGFPPNLRNKYSANYIIGKPSERNKISVVAGLWLGDPDVDSVARLSSEPESSLVTFSGHRSISHNLAVFNSQNTFISREIAMAYFLSPSLPRYDDIWISFVISKMMTIKGEALIFGDPIVNQIRNPHDYWKDVDLEKDAWDATNELVGLLEYIPNEPELDYIELAEKWIARVLLSSEIITVSRLVHRFLSEYAIWIHVVSRNFYSKPLL